MHHRNGTRDNPQQSHSRYHKKNRETGEIDWQHATCKWSCLCKFVSLIALCKNAEKWAIFHQEMLIQIGPRWNRLVLEYRPCTMPHLERVYFYPGGLRGRYFSLKELRGTFTKEMSYVHMSAVLPERCSGRVGVGDWLKVIDRHDQASILTMFLLHLSSSLLLSDFGLLERWKGFCIWLAAHVRVTNDHATMCSHLHISDQMF